MSFTLQDEADNSTSDPIPASYDETAGYWVADITDYVTSKHVYTVVAFALLISAGGVEFGVGARTGCKYP